MLKANKGEWSEKYTLFKILENNIISAGNDSFIPIDDQFYTFLKIIEEHGDNKLEYNLENPDKIIVISNGKIIKEISKLHFVQCNSKMSNYIKQSKATTFEISEAEQLMNELGLHKVKSPSHNKADLEAVIKDGFTNQSIPLGFSIKSKLGNLATLLNATQKTNFVYEITNFNGNIDDVNSIDGKSKVRDRLKYLSEHGAKIDFVSVPSETFDYNLRSVDSAFNKMLSIMLKNYYLGNYSTIADLCNNSKLDNVQITHKVKTFLNYVALGMKPGKKWDIGINDVNGGFIVVLENGNLICYNPNNITQFNTYLFNNTKFDTPSTTRHRFGKVYQDDGKLFIKLNFQIRFV